MDSLFVRQTRKTIIQHLQSIGANRILDIGCGEGGTVKVLNGKGFDAHGIDIKSIAKKKYPELEHKFYVGDVNDHSFEKEFDAVLLIFIVHTVSREERIKLLKTAINILKPGGQLIICDFSFTHGKTKSFAPKVIKYLIQKEEFLLEKYGDGHYEQFLDYINTGDTWIGEEIGIEIKNQYQRVFGLIAINCFAEQGVNGE